MSAYSPRKYWTELAERRAKDDPKGFAPVLHPNTPPWFNEMIDGLQFRAIRRALGLAGVLAGSRILDVGCGTGRWVRRYQEFGLRATGLDTTPAMLEIARENGTVGPLITGEARHLPFGSETFDCISDITVVQHIPSYEQPQALYEMIRVLRANGSLILMELIRGKGSHIFPRSPEDWIQQVTTCGARLIGWFPEEYLALDRLFVWAAQTLRGRDGTRARLKSPEPRSGLRGASVTNRAYWAIRHVSLPISVWTDQAVERVLPANWATHGVFVFRK